MHTYHTNKPIVYITMGDPAGIGPEIIMNSMASPELEGLAIFVIIGDAHVLKDFTKGENIPVYSMDEARSGKLAREGGIKILDPSPALSDVVMGKPAKEGSKKALICLDAAVELMQSKEYDCASALVTAPVSKEGMAEVHKGFIGHTEYLQEAFGVSRVTMVMVGKTFTVVPVTRHIPLKNVAKELSAELLVETLKQVVEDRFIISGKKDPKIGVSALNPHSGEGGKMGTEEGDIIDPAVDEVKKIYSNVEGPISADVVFYQALKGKVDIVIGMYHDQCLAPFKMIDFDLGVNTTLGLGRVRTSPDHGTAFDIAGKGIASPDSIKEAIKLALRAVSSG